jgi:hypothetical protein
MSQFSWLNNKRSKISREADSTRKWRLHVPQTFNRLHGVISKKTELFLTAALRISIPTNYIVKGTEDLSLAQLIGMFRV